MSADLQLPLSLAGSREGVLSCPSGTGWCWRGGYLISQSGEVDRITRPFHTFSPFYPFGDFRFVKACRFRCVQARHKKRGTGHADPAVRTNPLLIRSSTATLIGQEGGWEGASFLTALLQVNEVHLLAFGVQDVISHALMRRHRGSAAVRHEC